MCTRNGNLVHQQKCCRVSGPLSHRSRWGAKCAHATFDVDGLIHRVVLLLESRSRLKKLDRVATVASLTHSHAPMNTTIGNKDARHR